MPEPLELKLVLENLRSFTEEYMGLAEVLPTSALKDSELEHFLEYLHTTAEKARRIHSGVLSPEIKI